MNLDWLWKFLGRIPGKTPPPLNAARAHWGSTRLETRAKIRAKPS